MTRDQMTALFSWETEWPELCRAPILYYYISELVCDYHSSSTCIFFSLRDWVEVEVTGTVKPECGCGGEERLCSHKTEVSYDRECVCGAGRVVAGKGKSPHVCVTGLHHCTVQYHNDPSFLGESPSFKAVGSVPHIPAMTAFQITLLSYWNELLSR